MDLGGIAESGLNPDQPGISARFDVKVDARDFLARHRGTRPHLTDGDVTREREPDKDKRKCTPKH